MPTPFYLHLCRRHVSTLPKPIQKTLSMIPAKYRPRAIQEAQQALTEYLHTTRSFPFTYAESISKNSLLSLSQLISRVEFSTSSFSKEFVKFLRYHPINEFEFLYESIGIQYNNVNHFLPPNKFFINEQSRVYNVACGLSRFGFPWNKLGKLFDEENCGGFNILSTDVNKLVDRLECYKEVYGFNTVTVIGICLVFPWVLSEKCSEIDALFDVMKSVFVEFDLASCIGGNVEATYEVCKKIRLFYDVGCMKGRVGKAMGRSKRIFVDYPEEVLVHRMEYFNRLNVGMDNIGMLILESPEILKLDLETPEFSVLGILKHFGMSGKELQVISDKYPYVLGKNKMANLPHVMRALDLHKWFFEKLRRGDSVLLGSYVISQDDCIDTRFQDDMEKIYSSRYSIHTISKLNFMHGIGFGENALTMKILRHLHGTGIKLQASFDCLLDIGVEFSKLCRIISFSPKVLNQNPEIIKKKVDFLCEDMESSLQHLDVFPAFLNFDLENRIKPRYRFHKWIKEKGLCVIEYSLSSMVATSEKNFIRRMSTIHRAAPKQWFECFVYKKPYNT